MYKNTGFLFHVHCGVKFLFHVLLDSLRKIAGSRVTYGGLQMWQRYCQWHANDWDVTNTPTALAGKGPLVNEASTRSCWKLKAQDKQWLALVNSIGGCIRSRRCSTPELPEVPVSLPSTRSPSRHQELSQTKSLPSRTLAASSGDT